MPVGRVLNIADTSSGKYYRFQEKCQIASFIHSLIPFCNPKLAGLRRLKFVLKASSELNVWIFRSLSWQIGFQVWDQPIGFTKVWIWAKTNAKTRRSKQEIVLYVQGRSDYLLLSIILLDIIFEEKDKNCLLEHLMFLQNLHSEYNVRDFNN